MSLGENGSHRSDGCRVFSSRVLSHLFRPSLQCDSSWFPAGPTSTRIVVSVFVLRSVVCLGYRRSSMFRFLIVLMSVTERGGKAECSCAHNERPLSMPPSPVTSRGPPPTSEFRVPITWPHLIAATTVTSQQLLQYRVFALSIDGYRSISWYRHSLILYPHFSRRLRHLSRSYILVPSDSHIL